MTEELFEKYEVFKTLRSDQIKQIWFEHVGQDIGVYTIDKFFMRFFKPLELVSGFFRVVPNFPRYAVTCAGRVKDLYTMKTVHSSSRDYNFVEIYVPSRKEYRSIGVHRLVGLAWVDNPDVKSKIFINHIDGNKQNNHHKNLEWVTPRENLMHAMATGLRKDNVNVRVFDIKTQTEHEFPSLMQAGLFMGFKDRVGREIFSLTFPESLVQRRYEVKVGDDDSPWYYLGKTEYEPPARYKIQVLKDGQVYKEYPGNRQLTKDWKLWNINNNTELLCRIAKERYPEYDFVFEDRNPILPVQARNIKTGQIIEAESRNEIARKTGVPKCIVRSYIKQRKNLSYNDWQFRFKSEEPWTDPEWKLAPRCIEATNLTTGVTQIFQSLRECARELGIEERRTIAKRIGSGIPYKNYLFKSPL